MRVARAYGSLLGWQDHAPGILRAEWQSVSQAERPHQTALLVWGWAMRSYQCVSLSENVSQPYE